MADPPDADGERELPATGVLIGVDVGQVRVGLAASDPGGILASPVATVAREHFDEGAALDGSDLDQIAAEVAERDAVAVIVGLPRSLSGQEGLAAERARRYARALQRRLEVPVRLWDERLTTVDAHRSLRDSGMRGRRQRAVVDQAAAVLILQAALEARSAGRPAGVPLGPESPAPRGSGRM